MHDAPNLAARQRLAARRGAIATAVGDCCSRQAQWGDTARAAWAREAAEHLVELDSALAAMDLTLFPEYVAARAESDGRGLGRDALRIGIGCLHRIVAQELCGELAPSVLAHLEQGARALDQPTAEPVTFLDAGAPLAELAREYLHELLAGRRRAARQRVIDAIDAGAPIEDIFIQVFQRTQRELGRLWQLNQVSIADEHYGTATTQLIMSELWPRILQTPRVAGRVLAVTARGDSHELGLRLVADFFEMAGWDAFYVGARVPAPSVLQAIERHRPDVLAVSASMAAHLDDVAELIAKTHAVSTVPILVGGRAFNAAPGLWGQLDADGFAASAHECVAVAQRLMENRRR